VPGEREREGMVISGELNGAKNIAIWGKGDLRNSGVAKLLGSKQDTIRYF